MEELLMSWEKTILGNITTIAKGKKHTTIDDYNATRYIQIEDLGSTYSLKFTKENGVDVNENDVVIAWDGANAGIVGTNLNGIIGSTLARIRPLDRRISGNFLFRYLQSKESEIKSARTGATIPHVNGANLRNTEVPLPNIQTQIRITTILDEADALRKADVQLLSKYDEVAQASFLQLFGDPVRSEKRWETKRLNEVLSRIVAGTSYGGEEKELDDSELGVLKISAVTKGFFDNREYKAVKKNDIVKKVITPRRGDLLFSRANTRELVAATCIVDRDYPLLFLPDKLWRIDLNLEKCNQYYLKFLLSHDKFRNALTKTATGTSGSMLNISMDKLKSLVIPLPPINIQKQFEEIAIEVEEQKKITQNLQQQSENLFQSLLQKALKGEL